MPPRPSAPWHIAHPTPSIPWLFSTTWPPAVVAYKKIRRPLSVWLTEITMAPASANSMAAAKPIARTADMNRIKMMLPACGIMRAGRPRLSRQPFRTSLTDPLHFRSNGYPDFAASHPPAPAPPYYPPNPKPAKTGFSPVGRSLFPGSAAGASFIEVFEYRDLGGRKAPGRVR